MATKIVAMILGQHGGPSSTSRSEALRFFCWSSTLPEDQVCFYRVDPEHETQARLTLRGACERLTPQQWYNQKITSASAFWANKGKRVKKEYYVGNQPTEEWAMTIEEYMSVCPEWAEQHREAWEELIRARWLRQDEEFAAVSRRNMENRGTGGTHCAGNRDYTRFKGKKVCIYMERPSFISPGRGSTWGGAS
ncbi:uncharacterized protein [Lolium perenne]|uniref:uncharacterized protein n=1 Tax=Lolium perenne TaxID=4522 RepID=UPI003A9928E7